MCVPLAIVGAAMSVVGTGVSVIQAHAQGQYQAKVAEQNAALEREGARQEIENTRAAALAHYRRVAQVKGNQIVGAAANGVDIDFGTAADALSDTELLANEDADRIYKQGNNNLRGRDIRASNYMAEAGAARSAAKGALVGGLFNIGSTVLGGATQYSKLKASGAYGSRASSKSVSNGSGDIVTMFGNRAWGF